MSLPLPDITNLKYPELFKDFVFVTDNDDPGPQEEIEQRHQQFEMVFSLIFFGMQDLFKEVSTDSKDKPAKSQVVQECRGFEDMIANMAIMTGGYRNDGYSEKKDAMIEAAFVQYINTRAECTRKGYFSAMYEKEMGPELL
ncbi:hypothetical protein KEM56_006764 [Ascosphaera pollenicola]|nr:hypothetical protein KEM56_006764 [Ascosphaera pollenicola]